MSEELEMDDGAPRVTHQGASKVPEVTLGFWIIKIAATTLGETGGDWGTMSLNLGYLLGSIIFIGLFVGLVAAEIRAKTFHPALYWATIIATTILGTTMADFADRSLGVGYPGGVMIVLTLLIASLVLWHWVEGTVSVQSITTPRAEWFYWCTILFSQTLGTALGDWTADSAGLGYLGAAAIFSALLLIILLLHFFSSMSKTALFWSAFVLTRPLGAVVGDFLDKPVAQGGLELSRYVATGVLFVAIVILVLLLPQKAARSAH
ncbi:MAG TPA: hypothetical protein VFD73_17435 [Gemmatimonadales bacterium]|nr:hypothetical protein [Gemmatimonadales bacterium]